MKYSVLYSFTKKKHIINKNLRHIPNNSILNLVVYASIFFAYKHQLLTSRLILILEG